MASYTGSIGVLIALGIASLGCGTPAHDELAAAPTAAEAPAPAPKDAPPPLAPIPAPAPAPAPAPEPAPAAGAPSVPHKPGRRSRDSDMAAMMKDSFKAPYLIALHPYAQVGQWASWEASGQTMWWGVTGTRNGRLVVENRMGGLTYVYVVDAEGNTQEAYLANWEAGVEPDVAYPVKIAEKIEAPAAGEMPEPETGEETVTAAGRDWRCRWTKVDAGGRPATSWMADDAWFHRIIKSEYDGNLTMVLTATGTDAQLGFRWPE